MLFPPEPTISSGGTLDYAVCHPKLPPITTCEVLWGTPFKPHAAVQYTLQLAAAHHPVLQAPSFSKEIAASIDPKERPEDPQSSVIPNGARIHGADRHDMGWLHAMGGKHCVCGWSTGSGMECHMLDDTSSPYPPSTPGVEGCAQGLLDENPILAEPIR